MPAPHTRKLEAAPLAALILARATKPLTQLQLQKLLFYVWGALLSRNAALAASAAFTFEAWKYGPVVRPLWERLRDHGPSVIPRAALGEPLAADAVVLEAVDDILAVYGQLSAGALVQASHEESPWREASASLDRHIPHETIAKHFAAKFAGPYALPDALSGASSFRLDGLPDTARFASLSDAADFFRRHQDDNPTTAG